MLYAIWLVVFVVIVFGIRIWMQQGRPQRGGPPPITGPFGAKSQPCDGEPRVYTFAGGVAVVLVRVTSVCASMKIEYQRANGTWADCVDKVGTELHPISPSVGDTIGVSLPDGKSLRVTCMPVAGSSDGQCTFDLINGYRSSASDKVELVPEHDASACGRDQAVPVFNFLQANAMRVRITWTGLCKVPNAPHADVPQAPIVKFRVMGTLASIPNATPGPAEPIRHTAGENSATWTGNIPLNTALIVNCPGTIPGCRFKVECVL